MKKLSYGIAVLVLALAVLLPVPAAAQTGKTDLTLNLISGNFVQTVPGKEQTFFLEVSNSGNETITNIILVSSAPRDWLIEFQPVSIDRLDPGGVQTVQAKITPSRSATSGTYTVNVVAQASQISRALGIYLTIQTATTLWWWVGGGIGAALVVVFVVIFLRFGRK